MKKQYISFAAAVLMGATLTLTSCAEGNNGDMPPESVTGDTQITGPAEEEDYLADSTAGDTEVMELEEADYLADSTDSETPAATTDR